MKSLRERIEEAKRNIRANKPAQEKVVRKRQPYKRGAKGYLSSFKVGETRLHEDQFNYDSLKSIASILKASYGCQFCFCSTCEGKFITRIR